MTCATVQARAGPALVPIRLALHASVAVDAVARVGCIEVVDADPVDARVAEAGEAGFGYGPEPQNDDDGRY